MFLLDLILLGKIIIVPQLPLVVADDPVGIMLVGGDQVILPSADIIRIKPFQKFKGESGGFENPVLRHHPGAPVEQPVGIIIFRDPVAPQEKRHIRNLAVNIQYIFDHIGPLKASVVDKAARGSRQVPFRDIELDVPKSGLFDQSLFI